MTPAEIKPEPAPTREARSVEVWPSALAKYGPHMSPELRALCEARDAQGRAKYGVPLTTFNGRDAAVDALQEALDGIAYSHQGELECDPTENAGDSDEYWAAASRCDRFISIAESALISLRLQKRRHHDARRT